jgi:hypothetical protein
MISDLNQRKYFRTVVLTTLISRTISLSLWHDSVGVPYIDMTAFSLGKRAVTFPDESPLGFLLLEKVLMVM